MTIFYVFLLQTLGGAGDDEMQEEDMDEDLNVDDEVNIEEMLDEELPVSVHSFCIIPCSIVVTIPTLRAH